MKIIQEDKKIEKMDIKEILMCDDHQYIFINFKNTWNKINELIEEIEKLKGKSE